MDLLREPLEPRWVTVQITPAASVQAVSLEDTVGLKARAWHDRFVIRDIIDLHTVAGTFSYADLENLARRHDPDLDLEAIRDHLAGASVFSDDDFAEYGLDEPRIADLRSWVTGWYDDLALRLAADLTDCACIGIYARWAGETAAMSVLVSRYSHRAFVTKRCRKAWSLRSRNPVRSGRGKVGTLAVGCRSSAHGRRQEKQTSR
jgi:Nucleotidyl transferase AbiEii toxin, Type IV TA system